MTGVVRRVVGVHLVCTVVDDCLVWNTIRVELVGVMIRSRLVRIVVRIHLISMMIAIRFFLRLRHAYLTSRNTVPYVGKLVLGSNMNSLGRQVVEARD